MCDDFRGDDFNFVADLNFFGALWVTFKEVGSGFSISKFSEGNLTNSIQIQLKVRDLKRTINFFVILI
jgi:hypothetical protein